MTKKSIHNARVEIVSDPEFWTSGSGIATAKADVTIKGIEGTVKLMAFKSLASELGTKSASDVFHASIEAMENGIDYKVVRYQIEGASLASKIYADYGGRDKFRREMADYKERMRKKGFKPVYLQEISGKIWAVVYEKA